MFQCHVQNSFKIFHIWQQSSPSIPLSLSKAVFNSSLLSCSISSTEQVSVLTPVLFPSVNFRLTAQVLPFVYVHRESLRTWCLLLDWPESLVSHLFLPAFWKPVAKANVTAFMGFHRCQNALHYFPAQVLFPEALWCQL